MKKIVLASLIAAITFNAIGPAAAGGWRGYHWGGHKYGYEYCGWKTVKVWSAYHGEWVFKRVKVCH